MLPLGQCRGWRQGLRHARALAPVLRLQYPDKILAAWARRAAQVSGFTDATLVDALRLLDSRYRPFYLRSGSISERTFEKAVGVSCTAANATKRETRNSG